MQPYRYKPEYEAAIGQDTAPRVGVMAQGLERSRNPVVRGAVTETPIGKAIDGPTALGAALASLAGMDKRVKALESARK